MKHLLPTLALATICLAPLSAAADSSGAAPIVVPPAADAPAAVHSDSGSPSVGAQLADAVLVRIPMVGVSLASTGLYLGTSPLTFLMDVDQQTANALYRAPWKFTAGRELGVF